VLMVEGGVARLIPSGTDEETPAREPGRHGPAVRVDPIPMVLPMLDRRLDGWGVRVAESGVEPPRTIPNRVVPGASAGEYCAGDRVGGEAVARTPQPPSRRVQHSLP
jgi:hypothetical protein